MSFLLDTNLVSEWVKPRPDPGVVAWLAGVDEDRVFLSVVTLAELRHGIARMAGGARRDRLQAWLQDELSLRFEGRILAIDGAAADAWGVIMAESQAAARPMGAMDAFVAAVARVHDLVLVTRNERDFAHLGRPLVNPWSGRDEN